MKVSAIRYLVGIFLGILGGFLVVHLLLLSIREFRWHPDAQYIGAWYDKKGQIANEIPTSKIIFAGGSNVQYGIRAGLVEEKIGKPAVNFGTHAALPFAYLLERVKKIAKPGDTIVLIPEYEYYFLNPYELNPTSLRYLSVCGQDFLKQSSKKYLELLLTIPPEILFARFFTDSKKVEAEVQSKVQEHKSAFDKYGDRNWISKDRMGDREKRLLQSLQPTSLANPPASGLEPSSKIEFKKFQSWCQDRNVRLLVTFPNTIIFDEYLQPDSQKFLNQLNEFYKQCQFETLLTPRDSMLPKEDFFDTVYHLNEEGATKRTHKLIVEISEKLKSSAN
jgi:hypothetical protein